MTIYTENVLKPYFERMIDDGLKEGKLKNSSTFNLIFLLKDILLIGWVKRCMNTKAISIKIRYHMDMAEK